MQNRLTKNSEIFTQKTLEKRINLNHEIKTVSKKPFVLRKIICSRMKILIQQNKKNNKKC